MKRQSRNDCLNIMSQYFKKLRKQYWLWRLPNKISEPGKWSSFAELWFQQIQAKDVVASLLPKLTRNKKRQKNRDLDLLIQKAQQPQLLPSSNVCVLSG